MNDPLEGFCQCGCGEKTKISPRTDGRAGHLRGHSFAFICGHSSKVAKYRQPTGDGLCECGCGQQTNIIRGRFNRFLIGHFTKGKPGKYGDNNPNWKGGKRKNDQGYVLIRDHEYQRKDVKNEVRESIIIAERALGKPLPPKAVVHHTNGSRDSGPLVICQDQAYHMLLHQRLRALRACGHASWLKCPYCKEYDDPINLHINKRAHYHTKCQTEHQRKRYGKKRILYSTSIFRG